MYPMVKNILLIGPRVQDLGGFKENKLQKYIKKEIKSILEEAKENDYHLLTSLQLGIETWAAEQAFALRVPYTVFIPFKNIQSKWPTHSRKTYENLLSYASEKIVLDNGGFSPKKMSVKDEAMINKADLIYNFFPDTDWNLSRAEKANKEIIHSLPDPKKDDYFIAF